MSELELSCVYNIFICLFFKKWLEAVKPISTRTRYASFTLLEPSGERLAVKLDVTSQPLVVKTRWWCNNEFLPFVLWRHQLCEDHFGFCHHGERFHCSKLSAKIDHVVWLSGSRCYKTSGFSENSFPNKASESPSNRFEVSADQPKKAGKLDIGREREGGGGRSKIFLFQIKLLS